MEATKRTLSTYDELAGETDLDGEALNEWGDKVQHLLEEANRLYYGSGTSPLSDAEYDGLSARLEAALGLKVQTGERVSGLACVPHRFPDLATWLDKIHGAEELREWAGEAPGGTLFIVTPKYDGMSLVGEYDSDGSVLRVLTRGDPDTGGADVTAFFAGEQHMGERPHSGPRGVKYEAVIRWSDLRKINEIVTAEGREAYKNPRNTVAGLIRGNSKELREYVTLAPLDATGPGFSSLMSERVQSEGFEAIIEATNVGNVWQTTYGTITDDVDELILTYEDILKMRDDPTEGFDMMIDGVVVVAELPGGGQNTIAVKFPPARARTRAVSLDWDVGSTGRATPVINYEPVVMNGNTYSRASISNLLRHDALRLGPGSPIIVELRGDILAWIDRDPSEEAPVGMVPFESRPEGMLSEQIDDEGRAVFAFVEAPLDARCERVMVKCGMKGIRRETLQKLVEAGIISDPSDIWGLPSKVDEMEAVDGLGRTSAEAIARTVGAKLAGGVRDWEILASLNVSSVGRTLSRSALQSVTLKELAAALTDDTLATGIEVVLAGKIGPVRARTLIVGVMLETEPLKRHMAAIPNIIETMAMTAGSDGPKHTVVVTGDLVGFERQELKTLLEDRGHRLTGSVSKKTTLLITNFPESGTTKIRDARRLGIPIVGEAEGLRLLGMSVAEQPKRAIGSLGEL